MSESGNHNEAGAKRQTEQRDARGRFAAGNKGGPRNPFGRRTAELRKAMLAAISGDDLQAIMVKLVELARAGDVPAAKLVLHYAVGKPTEAADPDRVDIDEFQLYQEATTGAEAMSQVMERMPVETACSLVRAVRPVLAEAQKADLLVRLEQADEEKTDDNESWEGPAESSRPGAGEKEMAAVKEALGRQASAWQESDSGRERSTAARPSAIGANRGAAHNRQKPSRERCGAAPTANGGNGESRRPEGGR
jgi:hypothetical protein